MGELPTIVVWGLLSCTVIACLACLGNFGHPEYFSTPVQKKITEGFAVFQECLVSHFAACLLRGLKMVGHNTWNPWFVSARLVWQLRNKTLGKPWLSKISPQPKATVCLAAKIYFCYLL